MIWIFRSSILVALVVAGTACGVSKLCADDGLEAHWKAVGGRKAIAKINTVHRRGTLEGTTSYGPVTGRYEDAASVIQRLGYSSMALSVSGYAYNRNTGWTKEAAWSSDPQNGVQNTPKAEADFTALLSAPSPLLAIVMQEPSATVRLTGEKEFNGKQCDLFQVVGFGGEFFVNQTTHLLEGVSIPGNLDLNLSDYEAVDGVQFPHKQTLRIHAQDTTFIFTFTEIDVNKTVDLAKCINKQPSSGDASSPSGVTASQVIRMMDKDNDGKIDKSEASEDLKLFFGDYDTDDDGLLDATEAKAIATYVNSSSSKKNTPTSSGSITAKQMVRYMDKNGDDKISKDEGGKELEANFHYIDTDGDGYIDVKEAEVMAAYANKAK